jgi:hypothetical protein
MERLTDRGYKGRAFMKEPVENEEERTVEIIERLAAYEDTGMEPEEVNGMVFDNALDIKFGVTLDRLRELAEADRDGRLVVLPCKVGDTVYYPYAGRVIPKRITQYREILRKSEAIDRWYCLEFSNDETFDADDIGKSVFLAREDAEKALEEHK